MPLPTGFLEIVNDGFLATPRAGVFGVCGLATAGAAAAGVFGVGRGGSGVNWMGVFLQSL